MIIQAILVFIMMSITFMLSVFALPAMPLVVVDAINGVVGFFALPIGVIRNYVGDDFLIPVLYLLIIYVTFYPIWYMSTWIYQRVRG